MPKLEELKKDELLSVAKTLEAEVESLKEEILALEDRISNDESQDTAATNIQERVYLDPSDILLLTAAAQILRDPQTGGVMDPPSFEYNAPLYCEQAVKVAGMLKKAFADSLNQPAAKVEEVPTRETIPG